jgi:hypothetical protein
LKQDEGEIIDQNAPTAGQGAGRERQRESERGRVREWRGNLLDKFGEGST